jgi:hypothetical protein
MLQSEVNQTLQGDHSDNLAGNQANKPMNQEVIALSTMHQILIFGHYAECFGIYSFLNNIKCVEV